MEKLETVNEIDYEQIVNRFPKLSKLQKNILEWLAKDHGYSNIWKRTSGEIALGLLSKKHGRKPYDPMQHFDWKKREFDKGHDDVELVQKYHFIHADSRLPHFLAQLKKENPKDLSLDDIYEEWGNHTKKELLKEANKLRASVCRSLKRLLERGLIVQLHVTKQFNVMGRSKSVNRNHYFITKEQGQKCIDSDKFCSYEGHWVYESNKR